MKNEEKFVVIRATPQGVAKCELTANGWKPTSEDAQFICILSNSKEWQGKIPPFGCVVLFPTNDDETFALAERMCKVLNESDFTIAEAGK